MASVYVLDIPAAMLGDGNEARIVRSLIASLAMDAAVIRYDSHQVFDVLGRSQVRHTFVATGPVFGDRVRVMAMSIARILRLPKLAVFVQGCDSVVVRP